MKLDKFVSITREEPTLCFCDRDEGLKPGERYGPVMRDCYLVECCTGGRGSLIINGREFPLVRGVCAIVPPGVAVVHTADIHEPRRGVWCAIDGLRVRSTLAAAGITAENPYAPEDVTREIYQAVEDMIAMKEDCDPGAELRRTALVYRILGAIMRHSDAACSDGIIERAIGYMETEHYRPLSVGAIARTVGLERSYFSTLFKRRTGMSPHAYLDSLKVRKSCVLMRESGCSVSEAALAVGLDPTNFSRIFRRIYGITPREFLKGESKIIIESEGRKE